jgi:hypothetical protein
MDAQQQMMQACGAPVKMDNEDAGRCPCPTMVLQSSCPMFS